VQESPRRLAWPMARLQTHCRKGHERLRPTIDTRISFQSLELPRERSPLRHTSTHPWFSPGGDFQVRPNAARRSLPGCIRRESGRRPLACRAKRQYRSAPSVHRLTLIGTLSRSDRVPTRIRAAWGSAARMAPRRRWGRAIRCRHLGRSLLAREDPFCSRPPATSVIWRQGNLIYKSRRPKSNSARRKFSMSLRSVA
jgi:hypothetical protein